MPTSKSLTAKASVSITLPKGLLADVRTYAGSRERSVSYVVEKALIAYLRDQPSASAPPR